MAAIHEMTEPSVIRVLLVGPSMDILGGQAVQVTRLQRTVGRPWRGVAGIAFRRGLGRALAGL